ncbi:very short patch repair endonuclease [Corallococcus sp. bb12-1]|uniref:very short patch repair endonuclease n=1 Tax=Corallococcus sp. bb12-1 TaxID=2996784 RepID=UPI002271398E|nr:very short patch repair endonuclease [Corallococcus sp. bb12-1]MCY1040410.1 very short patch repair endonuclease [Corallococcus sp. bb12-1]
MGLSRSQQMSRIRGSNTKPELLLRRALWSRGRRYRLHTPTPVGKPDIVFLGARVAVFIDGCFWHGCPDHYVRPRTRDDFWSMKLTENVERDRRQTVELERLGWRVCRLWEHQVWEDTTRAAEQVEQAVEDPDWRSPQDWRVVRVEALGGPQDLEHRHLRELKNCALGRVVVQSRSTRKWSRRA